MLMTEGTRELPLYLPEGKTVYAIITGPHPRFDAQLTECRKQGPDFGKPQINGTVCFEILEGEYQGMVLDERFYIGLDHGRVFGTGRLQALLSALGIYHQAEGRKSFPIPETVDEWYWLVNGEGTYEVNGWNLRGKLIRIETGDPWSVTKTKDDGSEVTYHNTTIKAYRALSTEELDPLMPLADQWRLNNPF